MRINITDFHLFDFFLTVITENFAEGGVYHEEFSVRAGCVLIDGHRQVFHKRSVSLLAFPERCFGFGALGDIPITPDAAEIFPVFCHGSRIAFIAPAILELNNVKILCFFFIKGQCSRKEHFRVL